MSKQLPAVDQIILRDPSYANLIIDSTLEAFRNGIEGSAQEMKLLIAKPWGFNLENIIYPITIWAGALDKQVPTSHTHIYANLMPAAQLKIFENEGHISLIKNQIENIFEGVSIRKNGRRP